MDDIFKIATDVSTPLMLAGFLAAAFFLIARQVIKANIFPQLTGQLSSDIIKIIIERLFILALIATILGFIGYIVGLLNPRQLVSEVVKDHYEMPDDGLLVFRLEEMLAINFAPKPDLKNLTIRFKVIPRSKDKFVPLKTKGDLIVIDTMGGKKTYQFDVNMEEEGVKPQVVSFIHLDGFIPKGDYEKIIRSRSFKAKCVFYYDSDIVPTDLHFETDVFDFDENGVRELSE